MDNRNKLYIVLFILSLILGTPTTFSTGIIEKSPTVAVLMDNRYGESNLWSEFGMLFHDLTEGRRLLVYDVNHKEIADIFMKSDYPENLREKAFAKQLDAVEDFLRNPPKAVKHSTLEHLDFLARIRQELKADQYNAVIFTPSQEQPVEKAFEAIPGLSTDNLVTTPNSPYFVRDNKSLSGLIVHIQYPLQSQDSNNAQSRHFDYCRLLELFIQESGGTVGSCQSENVANRLFNPSIYLLPISEFDRKPNELLANFDWESGILKRPINAQPEPTIVEKVTPQFQAMPNLWVLPIPVDTCSKAKGEDTQLAGTVCGTPNENPNNSLVELHLAWVGEADMDLSTYSNEGNLNYATPIAPYGGWKKGPNWEHIALNHIPPDAWLRVVHSSGRIPKKITLNTSRGKFTRSEPLEGIFKKEAIRHHGEFIYARSLVEYISGTSVIGVYKKKAPY